MTTQLQLIRAQWPAPLRVQALSTTRAGGYSVAPYTSNNFALHVGDNPDHVLANRRALSAQLQFTHEPAWLTQTHSTNCVVLEQTFERHADAAVTRLRGQPLVILTADCLPIVMTNHAGDTIAAVHAGWRGLASGIIERTIQQMQCPPCELIAWVGPAICGNCYTVGAEVIHAFCSRYPDTVATFTTYRANLPQLAESILRALGVASITQSALCTYEATNHYYSYRRQAQTGRIATFIWIQPD